MATVEATSAVSTRRLSLFRPQARRVLEMVLGGAVFLNLIQYALGFSLVDPSLWARYSQRFWAGLFGTIGYIALILPVSATLGFFLGWARVSRFRVIAWPVSVYVEFFRGVPQLVIIIFASILGPLAFPPHMQSPELGFLLGAIALTLHSAAFQAEIFRAGFQSVSSGQQEAAFAIGLSQSGAMKHVILPQALRLSLPPLSNEFAVVIKDTSLLSAIGARELFYFSDITVTSLIRAGAPLQWLFVVWGTVAIAYFVMTFTVTQLMRFLEKRFHARSLEAISI
jgi:His/Glu/Gln/Arg/opine family amino acid ABC transporter permease subunit